MTLVEPPRARLSAIELEPARDAVVVDGKFFRCGEERFNFRGVTYGTFRARSGDGQPFPEPDLVDRDFAAMRSAGFTVVRTYVEPPDDVMLALGRHGLRALVGVHWPDWRYLVGSSRRQEREMANQARAIVRAAARRMSGLTGVVALCLGNEVPADAVRWIGPRRVAELLGELACIVKDEDPDRLVTYANYPSTEYLAIDGLDFLTFNVFLEQRADFRRYLTRLQHLAGERPLVIGELGLDSRGDNDGAVEQSRALEWQLETAIERGVAGTCVFSWTDEWSVNGADVDGWHFGLTTADRRPRPSLDVAKRSNATTVSEIQPADAWPSITVVVCAYNAADTIDECLTHTCRLDYPNLDIVVIDDGSTDDTAFIASRHARAQVVRIDHAGLSAARNEGLRQATGRIIAYLDADAFPTMEWPYYLALAFDGDMVGCAGGPNVSPATDPVGAQRVAHATGGPEHVLLSDDRAEHVPGCNMAFWRTVLEQVGGFDPVYVSAGDDVDVCWKVLDRGWEIGFHPAALVWHHRRPTARAYVRQQVGYGRAESLVAARHPDRFNAVGAARWRGRLYGATQRRGRQRIYRGQFGTAAYQSVYRGGGTFVDVAHQLGVPVACALLATLPLAFFEPMAALPAAVAFSFLVLLAVHQAARVERVWRGRRMSIGFRAVVALLCCVQPLARSWGRFRSTTIARREPAGSPTLPGPAHWVGRGIVLLPARGARRETTQCIVRVIRHMRLSVASTTGWEDHDLRVRGSLTVRADVVTSGHVPEWVQVRVRARLRRTVVAGAAAVVLVGTISAAGAMILGTLLIADAAVGVWRARFRTLRRIIGAAGGLG
jgi:GT2 family glycosyltransferase